jgi:hypothetical protein
MFVDDGVIFERTGDGWSEELYLQHDGTFALVIVTEDAGTIGSVLSADQALEYFPEYADRIAAEGKR